MHEYEEIEMTEEIDENDRDVKVFLREKITGVAHTFTQPNALLHFKIRASCAPNEKALTNNHGGIVTRMYTSWYYLWKEIHTDGANTVVPDNYNLMFKYKE